MKASSTLAAGNASAVASTSTSNCSNNCSLCCCGDSSSPIGNNSINSNYNNNNNSNNNNNNRHTVIHLTNSLNPIQTISTQTAACCAKLVSPTSYLTNNNNKNLNKQSSPTTPTEVDNSVIGSTSGVGGSVISAGIQSNKNQQPPLYYSVFKLNESVDSPTTNMLLENGKLLYSPTTATSILIKSSFSTSSTINSIVEKPKINNTCNNNIDNTSNNNNNNNIKQRRMNDSTCSESNLKIVQQRSTSNSSSDEDDTTALSGDSNYFDPCNEEDLESEETSDNSDEEEEDDNEEDDEEEDEEEDEDSEEEDNDDDYFDDGSDEERDEEEEEDEENSNRFWFGIEEPCHVSRVLQLYCNFFELNAGRSANSRLPIQFIGKICRVIMSNDLFNIDDDTVRTFDVVDIYERTSNLQYGAVHRKLKTAYVETYYDNEGLPKKFRKRKLKDIPDESEHLKSSWLYSFPIYGTSEEYHYESSLVDKSEEIGYADLLNRSLQKFNCKCKEIAGSPNDSQFMYTPCQQDDDDDDDCDSDSDNSDYEGEDSSIPNYMKDLIPHLSGRGYLDTDICYGYFEDDK